MSELADKPGKYTNFSGKINYKDSTCVVKRANFELLANEKRYKNQLFIWLVFHGGIVSSGNLHNADIEECQFHGYTIGDSVFRSGIFSGSHFKWSYWLGGEWKLGKWSNSYDKFGRIRLLPPPFDEFDKADNIITEPGRYKNFTGRVKHGNSDFYIENGELEICNDMLGYSLSISDGTVIDGIINYVVANQITIKGDKFNNGIWNDGLFEGGIFSKSTWKSGTWIDGTWSSSRLNWYGGFDKNGIWHERGDSPDLWSL